MKTDKSGKLNAKQPVRILMNNKTFTIYEDDSYETHMYAFQLSNTNFIKSGKQCCFALKDNYKKYDFCGFDSECNRKKNAWAQGWGDDFSLFKYQCKAGIRLLNSRDLKVLNDKIKDKLGHVKADLVNKKQKMVTKKIKQRDLQVFSNKVTNTQNMGLKVLSKQLNIEDLLTKEEKDKEALDVKNILDKIKKEKEKKKCLHNKIKEKRRAGQMDIDKGVMKSDISHIKKDLALDIQIKRAEVKKKIKLLRKRAKHRTAALNLRLLKVKTKMANELMAANKNGMIQSCKKGKNDEQSRIAYCNVNFRDDFVKNTDCKEVSGFCYMCCENEFGDMFMKNREHCYNMCDNKGGSKKTPSTMKAAKSGRGKWVWKPKAKATTVKK